MCIKKKPVSVRSGGPDSVKTQIPDRRKKPNPSKHFPHLFNAYAKHVNDKYNRRESLFQRPFKRKQIDSEDYLRRTVIYIHTNPVHHGFSDHLSDRLWSSYYAFLSLKSTKIKRKMVLDWFDGIGNFKKSHRKKFDYLQFERWLKLEHH